MLIEVAVDGDRRDLVLLRDWLIATPAIRRSATVRLAAPATTPGHMGSAAEWITVAGGTVAAIGALVTAVAAWRQSLRPTTITVTIRRAGIEVTLAGTDPAAIAEAIKRLEAAA